jgi:hypothetical protein
MAFYYQLLDHFQPCDPTSDGLIQVLCLPSSVRVPILQHRNNFSYHLFP